MHARVQVNQPPPHTTDMRLMQTWKTCLGFHIVSQLLRTPGEQGEQPKQPEQVAVSIGGASGLQLVVTVYITTALALSCTYFHVYK